MVFTKATGMVVLVSLCACGPGPNGAGSQELGLRSEYLSNGSDGGMSGPHSGSDGGTNDTTSFPDGGVTGPAADGSTALLDEGCPCWVWEDVVNLSEIECGDDQDITAVSFVDPTGSQAVPKHLVVHGTDCQSWPPVRQADNLTHGQNIACRTLLIDAADQNGLLDGPDADPECIHMYGFLF